MEKLVNCGLIMDIEMIVKISGGDQRFELFFYTHDHRKGVITFDRVWDFRYAIENGCIARFSEFDKKSIKTDSSILIVKNSKYKEFFSKQISGTLPTECLDEYIVFDRIDTVISLLSNSEPYVTWSEWTQD